MLNKKGVSMISLVIIIIIIIILAAISTPLLTSVIDDSLEQDAKVELKNVENVVNYARTQIMIDEFIPSGAYVISETDLRNKFGTVLSEDEITNILAINSGSDIRVKYFLMDQKRFDSEFGNGFNISDIRGEREYLVNYYYGTIVANYNGTKITNGNEQSITPADNVNRGEIRVTIIPNGNSNWYHSQDAAVIFTWNSAYNTFTSAEYTWSESISQPADSEFTNVFSGVTSGASYDVVPLDSETGNGWYLWIKYTYTEVETGLSRTEYIKSEPFFIDNIAPTADLEVNGIN